ncbi:MAG: gamma-glutamyltransferase [Myxococcota bacterium]
MRRVAAFGVLFCALTVDAVAAAPRSPVGSAAVASDHALASGCGAEVLSRGGNAADAAVATALCAGVVQPAGSGLGGGGFAVVVDASGARHVLDFREVAPEGAAPGMFLDDEGQVVPNASRKGGAAVAVPTESRGLARLHTSFGVLPARHVAAPAIRLARRGAPVGVHLAGALERTSDSAVREAFEIEGELAGWNQTIRRPALARTLARWARTKGEDLHEGKGALQVAHHVGEHGGVLTPGDLARASVVARSPIVVPFHGYTIVTMPPPSSGGVALAQMLLALDAHGLTTLKRGSVTYLHALAETMKHAYADRAHHLGDPDFVDVPVEELLGPKRVEEIVDAFDAERTFAPTAYGPLIAPPRDAGTQHISVRDEAGMAVALTTTINTSFGSGLVEPSTGIVLNNQMDDFVAKPGVPNSFGLVGDEDNAIAPWKRPLSSMTPTIVLNEAGETVLVLGASGGSTIISSTLQVLLDVLVFGVAPTEAVAAPRIHHQWMPNRLWMEPGHSPDVVDALTNLGHEVEVRRAYSAVQVLHYADGSVTAASDPRKNGQPIVLP